MRQITKGPEPRSLIAHRKTRFADYQNYPDKDELRDSLVEEQRGLCSYCLSRITSGSATMKIEHWQSQTHFPTEQIKYLNLLGGCLGGEGQPQHLQHCDTRKGDQDLQWNPADPAHHIETRLGYELDGTICAADATFNRQLNEVLNLNLPQIRNNRKVVLTALLEWWRAERPVPRGSIQRQIDERSRGVALTPYSQVAVWWLRQKLASMT